jgi:hypothetical protein
MPIVTQILCDACQSAKQKNSHWYTLTIRQGTVEISRLSLQPDGRPSAERDGLQQYFCGSFCLLEAITRWMDSMNKDQVTLPLPVFRARDGAVFVGDLRDDESCP